MRPTPGDFSNTKAYQRNPYFGNNRVEEDGFRPVRCARNRIGPAPAGTSDQTCLKGYHLVPAYAYQNRRWSRCQIDHDVTIYNLGDLSVEADVFVFDPYFLSANGRGPGPDCYVAGYSGYDQEDFQDMNRVTRGGTNWHDLSGETCDWREARPGCETKSIKFSDGPHYCIAVRRPGPRWQAGYVWMLTASICRTDMAQAQPDAVARALDAVQVHVYNPLGNIRPPPPTLRSPPQ